MGDVESLYRQALGRGRSPASFLRSPCGAPIVLGVRTLARYLVLSGIVVGLAYGLFVVKIGRKTAFGHARAFFADDMAPLLTRLRSNMDQRIAELEGSKDKTRPKKEEARSKPTKGVLEKKRAKDESPKKSKLGERAPAPAAPKPEPSAEPSPSLSAKERAANESQVRRLKEAETFAEQLRVARAGEPKKKTDVGEGQAERSGMDALLTAHR